MSITRGKAVPEDLQREILNTRGGFGRASVFSYTGNVNLTSIGLPPTTVPLDKEVFNDDFDFTLNGSGEAICNRAGRYLVGGRYLIFPSAGATSPYDIICSVRVDGSPLSTTGGYGGGGVGPGFNDLAAGIALSGMVEISEGQAVTVRVGSFETVNVLVNNTSGIILQRFDAP